MARRTKLEIVLSRVAFCSWLRKEAKRQNLPPRPLATTRLDDENLKADVLYILEHTKAGNTEANRRKLHKVMAKAVAAMQADESWLEDAK